MLLTKLNENDISNFLIIFAAFGDDYLRRLTASDCI